MSYHLGVDLGTSYTAAAISRDGVLEMVSLGTRSLEIPSVVFLDPSGGLVVGESAERRGAAEPARLAREFKRRLGDPAPILVGGTPFSAEALMATVLRSVIADVTARQGEPPAHVTLTRPANWGPYKQELFGHVPALADLGPSSTATEPEAAAVHFASTTRIASGQVVAIYDLGGGTFDAAVLRKTDDGFATLGTPEGIEHLGGADFDDAVFEYVRRVLGPAFSQLDPTDPAVRAAAARLRTECVLAKESLSRDTEATIPVALPGLQTEVRLTRQDFEDLVRPSLMTTVESLRRAVRSAKISPDEIAATVLAGGSSRIPLAAELITGELQLPVAVGTHPKHTVALGAALLAARNASRPPTEEPTGRIDPAVMATSGPMPLAGTGPVPVTGAAWRTDPRLAAVDPKTVSVGADPHPSDPSNTGSGLFGMPNQVGVLEPQTGRRRRSAILIAAIAAVAVALAAVLIFVQPWKSTAAGSPSAAASSSSVVTAATTPSPSVSTAATTDATTAPTSVSSEATTPSESSPAETSGAVVPSGVVCDPTTLALLGMIDVARPVDVDTTGDPFRPGVYGAAMEKAAKLAIKQFNANNPECKVTMDVYDTRHTNEDSKRLAPEIAADPKVLGVIGASFAGEIFTAEKVFEPANLALISPSAKSPGFAGLHLKTFNRVIAQDQIQGQAAANYLRDTAHATRVVEINDDNMNFGIPIGKFARDGLGDLAVDSVEISATNPSYTEALASVADNKPDAVYFAGAPHIAGELLTSLRQAGYQGTFLMAEAFNEPRVLQAVSPAIADGALMMSTVSPPERDTAFTDAYRAEYGEDPIGFAPEAYDSTEIFLKGIARGVKTRAEMVDYVRNYQGLGITKAIAFDQNGDVMGQPAWVYRIGGDGSLTAMAFVN